MKLDMYQATVLPCVRALTNLSDILDKAEAHSAARKIPSSVLLNTRLFPDMLPLTMQIVIAGDIARGGAARLAGADVPAFEGGKTTFGELIDGVRRSIAYLETLKPEQFEGAEERTVNWQTRSSTKSMQGTPYLFNHLLPNVYYHVTTAYDILRHSGMELGKRDYLGNI
ncbi:MAG TPA: DUF1993 domain-containing protein [Steroidobacteraceae bacterium]|nr:DUF1993 domain-containing protein [Steroidobacteraceae bacterium]